MKPSNRTNRSPVPSQSIESEPAQDRGNDIPSTRRPSNEEIARRAYNRWEQSGRRDGDDQSDWFAAEKELSESDDSETEETRRDMP